MFKFFGPPLKEITSKKTGKIMFRFDTKGEFITDDNEIIQRAMGFFDHIELKAEPVGERVKKTVSTPVMTITTNDACKYCGGTRENKGQELACARKHKKEAM